MVSVPFAPFEPDKSRYNASATPEIIDAVPTVDGWGPLKSTTKVIGVYFLLANENLDPLLREDGNFITVGTSFASTSGAVMLDDDATGMTACRKLDATEALFVGTETALYLFDKGGFSWDDVSSTAYASVSRWSFARFGQVVYAQNGFDPEQKFDVDNDSAFSDNTSAPVGKVIAAVGDFMMRGNLVGFPARIQWSAINDPQSNDATRKLSDYQDMPTGDEVMGLVALSGGAHVWMRSAVHGMAFALTSEFVFTRSAIDEVNGTSAPYSICSIGQDDYVVYTDNGFYRFKGGFQNIGEGKVNKWFLQDSDQNDRENIVASADPENNVIWFAYTRTDGTRRTLGYQYNLDRWCLSTMQIQASCRARTFAYSASEPPIIETDVLRFAMVTEERQLAYLVGSNLAAVLVTNELDFAPDRAFVNGAQLVSDATDFTVTHMTTDVRGGAMRTRDPACPSARSGRVPLRGDGRQHKFQIDIARDQDWSTATSVEIEANRSGRS